MTQPMTFPTSLASQLVLRPEFAHLQDPRGGDPPMRGAEPGGQPQTGDPATGQPAAQGSPCAPEMLIWMVLIFAVIYFMMIRPQQKQEKARRAMLGAIKKGDKVATSGGIHGTISNLAEDTVTLRVDNIKMTVDRTAIARVLGSDKPENTPG